ncbi:hypothetical protein GQ651_09090 [Alphaproteobacteria bacterium GH1-50]|uniref:Uncharacterized protein n=1 Tax=Kangsaoukella pontilimi TaxID=2691042 RepID=A0A7C9NE82_9RHOB|nr:hypothetical protein [Kangsaoukella pontilimi]MXQ07999.1 hypothetical protein [Kangsaoukella pontilimi]
MTESDDRILAVLPASEPRRWAGIGMLVCLGLLLIWTAFAAVGAVVWQGVFLICGVLALWGADAMRRATSAVIELTKTELRTDAGAVLARIEDVEGVERGAFAFKPSQGFLVRLKTPGPRGWAPGLWWRAGTFLGIGGVVSGGQSKAMAEILTALILERDGHLSRD